MFNDGQISRKETHGDGRVVVFCLFRGCCIDTIYSLLFAAQDTLRPKRLRRENGSGALIRLWVPVRSFRFLGMGPLILAIRCVLLFNRTIQGSVSNMTRQQYGCGSKNR